MNASLGPDRRPVAVLIGFMGAGKSTVGAALAALLEVEFVDTDHEIVTRAGRSVAEVFATDGERYFRDLEVQVVLDVLGRETGVVALGGGAVMTPAVQAVLADHLVVYLEVSPDVGFVRVRSSGRPLLQPGADGTDAEQRYRALLDERVDTYRAAARLTIDTTGRDAASLADEIARALRLRPASAYRPEGSPP